MRLQTYKRMKRIGLYTLGLLIAATQTIGTLQAAEPKVGEKEKAGTEATKAIPFQGTVVAVDLSGRSFSLNGKAKERLFKVTDKTEILLDNKPATLNQITVGASLHGNAIKHEDGWEAKKVNIGPKEPKK